MMTTTHAGEFNFDDLPEVAPTDSVETTAARLPRFDGDTSDIPNQACWVLQNLLTRRYLTKPAKPDLWAWLIEHRRVLASRLCELDLRLRIFEDLEVAYAEPAILETPSPHSRKVLRREPLGTYASIVALHLAKIARTSRDDVVLISRADIHDLFAADRHKVDRDEAMLRGRVDEAINKLERNKILLRAGDDENFIISPVILAIMDGHMVDTLTAEYERLYQRNANIETDDEPQDDAAPTDGEQESDDDVH